MAALFLDDEEIEAVTHKKRPSAQHRALNALGVTHKVRPDGTILVLRSHVEKQLGGLAPGPAVKESEPNWGALNG